MPAGAGYALEEFSRRHGDFAIIGIAAMIVREGQRCKVARLATAGAGPVPVRLRAAEEILERDGLGDAAIEAAARRATELVSPDADIHASAAYRRHLTGSVLTKRALSSPRSPRRASGKGGRRRARPGSRPVPRGCSAPERRADAAVAEACSAASWGGGIPLDRRPAPAENPVTRWFSALWGGAAAEGRGWGPRTAVPSTGPLYRLCSIVPNGVTSAGRLTQLWDWLSSVSCGWYSRTTST
jgi:CO dehydrogenase flavoprotein C-terminal domain